MTALYVTHDQAEAFALADRVAVMCRDAWHRSAPPTSSGAPGDEDVGASSATPTCTLLVVRLEAMTLHPLDGRATVSSSR